MRINFYIMVITAAALASACGGEQEPLGDPGDTRSDGPPDMSEEDVRAVLDARVVDYTAAFRTASLKLLDAPPTLSQIKALAGAADQAAAYEAAVDAMLEDARHRRRIVRWWKDTMRQGGAADADRPSRDTAPILAARIMLEERPLSDLFTATSNTCPGYDEATATFLDGDCENGVPVHAGVLTNPGVHHQFFGNMAFRRVRWVQEIFACTAFPAERSETPVEMVGGDYVSPWPLESVAAAPLDFQATSSLICANCHATINHIAPLFGGFDARGAFSEAIQVQTPTAPAPVTTEMSHWITDGEATAWRFGQPAPDVSALGEAIANDPLVAECAVARMWNFAMSREDIVSDRALVPREVVQSYVDEFRSNGMNLKKVLRRILLSDDFIRF